MNRRIVAGVAGLVVAGGAVAGYALYQWVLGETLEASEPITALPALVDAADGTGSPEAQAVRGRFLIDQEHSTASFTIYEELRGEPVYVVGTTDQIAGEILLDPDDLSASMVGVVRVNARTLVTDDERRNRAMRNRILHTDDHEYIAFAPREVRGLTETPSPGTPVRFQIAGDLTVREITRPVIFEATLDEISDSAIRGNATTTVTRGEFSLTVPNLPFLANVADDVKLDVKIHARPAEDSRP